MEYMSVAQTTGFGLFVNVYSGSVGARCKLVIGTEDPAREHWIGDIAFSEVTTLDSRACCLGFVNQQREYIAFRGRMGHAHTSSPRNAAIAEHAQADLWTLDRLFARLGFAFDPAKPVTVDLAYDTLTYDRLASLFDGL